MGYWFPKLGSGSTGEAPIDSKTCNGVWLSKALYMRRWVLSTQTTNKQRTSLDRDIYLKTSVVTETVILISKLFVASMFPVRTVKPVLSCNITKLENWFKIIIYQWTKHIWLALCATTSIMQIVNHPSEGWWNKMGQMNSFSIISQ